MATMVSTTLAQRSGSTVTFTPKGLSNGTGTLAAASNFAGVADKIDIQSSRSGSSRRITRLRVTRPQVDETNVDNPRVIREAFVELTINVPDGYALADINDLVGFVEKATATSVTNFNDLLVNGIGVY